MISIVIPCYNEEESLPFYYNKMKEVIKKMKGVKFELIFINDGSKDKTLEILKDLSKKDKIVKYISFSRNFGKEAGMLAGLQNCKGDYVAIMDADLQDPPELIIDMYNILLTSDYDCVGLRRVNRKGEPKVRSFFANCYYKIINKISSTTIVSGARDFRLMTRQMVDSILELNENNRYSKGIFSWVGYNTKWLEYNNLKRVAGVTKWSFTKLFKYSIESILAFSTFPLVIPVIVALFFALLSFILFIIMLFAKVSDLFKLITFISFVSSIQFMFIGILGAYVSKMHIELQNRPKYIIKETNIK